MIKALARWILRAEIKRKEYWHKRDMKELEKRRIKLSEMIYYNKTADMKHYRDTLRELRYAIPGKGL